MSNTRVPKYARAAVDPPVIREGQLVVVENIEISEVEGDYGPQYQLDGNIKNMNFRARAWIKKYDDPTVKTKIVKLCMLVEEYTGKEFDTIAGALDALKSIGRLYFQCTGHRRSEDTNYPKFSINTGSIPEPEQAQTKIGRPESSAEGMKFYDRILSKILDAKPSLTTEAAEALIAEEKAKMNGLLTDEAAVALVARELGVNLTA